MRKWFKGRTFGWGWQPATWQGWVIFVLFVAFIVWSGVSFYTGGETETTEGVLSLLLRVFGAFVVMILIAALTGGKPGGGWWKKR